MFDLDKALKTGKAYTREGKEVTQLTLFNIRNRRCVAGVIDNLLYFWDKEGRHPQTGMGYDLQLENPNKPRVRMVVTVRYIEED